MKGKRPVYFIRKATVLFLVIAVISTISIGCGSKNASDESIATTESKSMSEQIPDTSEKVDPFKPYDNLVTVTLGRDAGGENLPEGDTLENNAYTRWIKEAFNIEVKHAWTVSQDYDQKVNLVMSSGDLPDIMMIRNQNQLNQLIESDTIVDLTTIWKDYASPLVLDIYKSFGEGVAYRTVMKDNKMTAIPSLDPGYQYDLMWARKDWMDKIEAKVPKTMDEVVNLAKEFVDKDPGGNGPGKTIGILTNNYLAGKYNSVVNLDPLFNYYKSFPRQWFKNSTGKYTYGAIEPETKTALAKVAEMYKMGLIDKEFAVKADVNADIAVGKSGIVFGPWWISGWPLYDSVKNNPEADWIPIQAPVSEDGTYNTYLQNPSTAWIVVSKECKNPEVAVKLLNICAEAQVRLDAFPNPFTSVIPDSVLNAYEGKNIDWGVWPYHITLRYNDEISKNAAIYADAIDNGKTEGLPESAMKIVKIIKEFKEGNHDLDHWANTRSNYDGMKLLLNNNVKIIDNVYPGVTKTMELKWANLEKLQDEAFLKIIMGEESIEYFDEFAKEWRAQGGDQIIDEVNNLYNN